ncbi:MAG: endonuclease V [Haloferacaceae archaeon]
MTPVRPEFVPEAGLDREEMHTLQRELSSVATFADDLRFLPSDVRLEEPVRPDDRSLGSFSGGEPNRTGSPVVAGVDQAFVGDRAVSAVVLLQDGSVVGRTHAVSEPPIPYVPGLLAFREGGPIVDALVRLEVEPDLLVFDGSGRIHFREAGLATHIGVVFDLPSVGVAKSLLCGTPDEPPGGRPAGWSTPIRVGPDDDVAAPEGTVLGYAYQSRQYDDEPRINPLYVSPGHRVSAETARDLVAALCAGYKLPEPTRLADRFADALKRDLAE